MRKQGGPLSRRKTALTASWSMFAVGAHGRLRQVRAGPRLGVKADDPPRQPRRVADRRPVNERQNHRLLGDRRRGLVVCSLAELEVVPELPETRVARVAETG